MERFLIGSAVVLFIFGMLFLLKPNIIKKFSYFLNKIVFSLEDRMFAAPIISGSMLLMLSIVVFSLAAKH